MRLTVVRGLSAVVALLLTIGIGAGLAPQSKAQQAEPAAEAGADADARVVAAKGAWSPTKNYVTDDLVTSRGSTWRAKRPNKGKLPGSTAPSTAKDWELFAAGLNPLGAWLGSSTYQANDLVTHQGATWRALRTNLNKVPVAGANWVLFAAKGDAGTQGTPGPTGPAGPNSIPSGTASAPAISFSDDTHTGIFSPSTGKLALVEGGDLVFHTKGPGNIAAGLGALIDGTGGQ
jgi:hypothetical protein